MRDLSGMILTLLIVIVIAFVIVMLLLYIFALVIRLRFERKAQHLPEQARQKLQADLLDLIKHASANRKTPVDVRPFWRGSGMGVVNRNAVIQPLIDEHLVEVREESLGDGFWSGLGDLVNVWWRFAFLRPPTHLMLTDRTWEIMVREGMSGHSIIAETYIAEAGPVTSYVQNSGGGDINGSPVGHNIRVKGVDVDKSQRTSGLTPEFLSQLVRAMRDDAVKFSETGERKSVRFLADELEDASVSDDPDERRATGVLTRVRQYAEGAAGVMTATLKVLEAWNR